MTDIAAPHIPLEQVHDHKTSSAATGEDVRRETLDCRLLAYRLAGQALHTEAIKQVMEAIACAPREAINYYVYAWIMDNANRPEPALTAIDQAIRLDPTAAAALLLRARVHHRLGRPEKAIADVRKAFEANAIDAAHLLLHTHAA